MVDMLVAPTGVPDRRPRTGYVLAGGASVLFAVNASVSKVALLGGIDAADLTALRSAGAFVGLLAWLALTRPHTLRVTRRELPLLAVYGIAGFAFVQVFYFVAIQRLPVAIALLLEYTAPVMVALWARFGAKEPVRRRVWGALALALLGLSLVAQVWGGGSDLDGVGVVAALLAAASLAFYFTLGERIVTTTRDPLSLACYAFGFATLFWSVVRPWWRFPWPTLTLEVPLLGNLAPASAPMWLLVGWIVVLGTMVPFAFIIASLRHLRATQAGIVAMTEPVGAAVVAWVWLGESLAPVQVVGGAVVLAGVVLAETSRAPAIEPAEAAQGPEGSEAAE